MKKIMFRKWIMISNYSISTSEYLYLQELCFENDIEFEKYDPSKIISLLEEHQIGKAAAYLDAIDVEIPYTNQANHQFMKQALQDICESIPKSTTQKRELLRSIINSINKKVQIDEILFPTKSYALYNNDHHGVSIRSSMNTDSIVKYVFIENRFIQIDKDQTNITIDPFYFSKNQKGNFVIWASNLFPLRLLCEELKESLNATGNYSIQDALHILHHRQFQPSL
ncbi:hypothetical protein ACH0BF_24050 [Pseudobacillus sp. 179-B 2D1 NHS]|uniref:hypothetical protein n=1 Tax=Pseudobacillus sp. 179-B 2D1 NHS TaxID=3374292 RepID=UPI00387968C7